ncbi:hypothetical protein BS78_08G128800 [Paspalum vaginatum]|nr:hypothetical protein BS78_08G128800 [Paspalum vaginatum]
MSTSSMVSKSSPPPSGYGGDGEGSNVVEATAVAPVTSCLYLRAGAGALDKDAVLRRIRHRRRHDRLRDTLRSMLQAPEPVPDDADGAGRAQLPWPLDDAFSAP